MDPVSTASALAAASQGSPDKARAVARDFEAVFLNELLQNMDIGVKSDGPFGGGPGESVYRSLFNDAVARQIAENGGIGIADAVYREIIRLQGTQGS